MPTTQIKRSKCSISRQAFTKFCCAHFTNCVDCWLWYHQRNRMDVWFHLFLHFPFTAQIKLGECCICLEYFTQKCRCCLVDTVTCYFVEKGKKSDCVWTSVMFFIHVMFTFKIKWRKGCVYPQCFSQCWCPIAPNFVTCLSNGINSKQLWSCVLWLWKRPRLRQVSVWFIVNAFPNDVAPLTPILLPILKSISKGLLWTTIISVSLRLLEQSRFKFESVVFVINAVLNDVIPVSPILLAIFL